MQNCPNCRYENPDTAMICERCGHTLEGAIAAVSTRKFNTQQLEERMQPFDRQSMLPVRLEIEGYDQPLNFQLTEPALLGRQGGEVSGSTFVNLEGYEAVENGVSRRHAMLSWQDEQLMICDLGSSNHTYLNGLRLRENRDYPLRHGDEIALGRLNVKIFFE